MKEFILATLALSCQEDTDCLAEAHSYRSHNLQDKLAACQENVGQWINMIEAQAHTAMPTCRPRILYRAVNSCVFVWGPMAWPISGFFMWFTTVLRIVLAGLDLNNSL